MKMHITKATKPLVENRTIIKIGYSSLQCGCDLSLHRTRYKFERNKKNDKHKKSTEFFKTNILRNSKEPRVFKIKLQHIIFEALRKLVVLVIIKTESQGNKKHQLRNADRNQIFTNNLLKRQ